MFANLRSLAPAVLLLASLSGQAATGIMLGHVASEHAVQEHDEGHQAADQHAAAHHSEAGGKHDDGDHGSEHSHQIVPATAAAPARVACPSPHVQPCLAAIWQGRFEQLAPSVLQHVAVPVLGPGPPDTQRHSILLL